MQEILYIKIPQNIPVKSRTLKFKDIADMYCANKDIVHTLEDEIFYTLPEKVREKVMYKNACRVLGLPGGEEEPACSNCTCCNKGKDCYCSKGGCGSHAPAKAAAPSADLEAIAYRIVAELKKVM